MYVLKYFVKNQNAFGTTAALALSSCSIKHSKYRELKEERIKPQLVYRRVPPVAYTKSNLNEVQAVPQVRHLLRGANFVCSHDFQGLHVSELLRDRDTLRVTASGKLLRGSFSVFWPKCD